MGVVEWTDQKAIEEIEVLAKEVLSKAAHYQLN
jgi:hypothetical protein